MTTVKYPQSILITSFPTTLKPGNYLVTHRHLNVQNFVCIFFVTFFSPHVSKTVLIVIDALRYDFIVGNDTSSNFPYLHSLIAEKQACVFPCRVYLPTVTMPRIKVSVQVYEMRISVLDTPQLSNCYHQAMTVGDTSNFLDIALNFGSSQIKHDNIIAQMKRKGWKTVFYGDDTWIKLFPNMFYRYEGVTSFFVSDFYDVR